MFPFAADGKGDRAGGAGTSNWSFICELRAGSDWASIDGGVREPLVGARLPAPLLPSLEVSAEMSVLKLALDRLRSSLKLKRDGAIVHRVARR